jgi:hypothetical protein
MYKLRSQTEFFLSKIYQHLTNENVTDFKRFTPNDKIANWTLNNFDHLLNTSIDFADKYIFWDSLSQFLRRISDPNVLEEELDVIVGDSIRKKKWEGKQRFLFILSIAIQLLELYHYKLKEVPSGENPKVLINIFCNLIKKYCFQYLKSVDGLPNALLILYSADSSTL